MVEVADELLFEGTCGKRTLKYICGGAGSGCRKPKTAAKKTKKLLILNVFGLDRT